MRSVDKPEHLESAIAFKMKKHFMSNTSAEGTSEAVDFDLSLGEVGGIFNATH